MFISEAFAVLAMLPWMWGLFQFLVLGNFYYLIYMLLYFLLFKDSKKETDRKKTKGTNVDTHDFTLEIRKDASTFTEEIYFANNKTCNKMIELNADNSQSGFWASNPFMEMIEDVDADGDRFNPFDTEVMHQPHCQLGNPFLDNDENSAAVNNVESHISLLPPTNPFLQGSANNPFIDSTRHFHVVLEDQFSNLPHAPRESDSYCKEWVEQHRKGHIKTLRSFSFH